MKTRITEMLGIEHPIIQGGMMWVGQVRGLIDDIPSCEELLQRMVSECEAIISQRLHSLVG